MFCTGINSIHPHLKADISVNSVFFALENTYLPNNCKYDSMLSWTFFDKRSVKKYVFVSNMIYSTKKADNLC